AGGAARDRPPGLRLAGHDAAHGHRRGLGEEPLRPGHHRPCRQRLGQAWRRLVPVLPGPAVAEPGHHQPAADPGLGRRPPPVLFDRVDQGQSVERAGDGHRPVRRPGPAGWPDGPGLLQRPARPAPAMTLTTTGARRRRFLPRYPFSTGCDMTRFPVRRLPALALASVLSLSAMAQTAEPFTVADIRIDGLQRIAAGTVFTYLPVERGETLDASKAGDTVRALYRTGLFEDVRLDRQGDILVITVTERPAINKLTLNGNKDINSEDLLRGLQDIGLAGGETFDCLALDRVTQALTRQYNNRGKYNDQIT